MFKKQLIIIFTLVLSVLLVSGCLENNKSDNTDDEEEKTIFSAKKYYNDKTVETQNDGTIKIDFKSFNDGDKFTVQDTINDIGLIDSSGNTFIKFQFQDLLSDDNNQQIDVFFIFEGDITNNFKTGDEVEISVTIKHVDLTYNNTNYDLEVFEEEWDQQYFETNGDFKPLPTSCIKKSV